VPVVEFGTLSIDSRDMISSRVDAFMGRIENREESALVARRPDDKFGPAPLECVPTVAGECEREWKGLVDDDTEANGGPAGGGVLERTDDGGGKKERLALGILRTKDEESEVRRSRLRWGPGAVLGTISCSLSALCANNEATVSRSA
jgi:hypothetical protein